MLLLLGLRALLHAVQAELIVVLKLSARLELYLYSNVWRQSRDAVLIPADLIKVRHDAQ